MQTWTSNLRPQGGTSRATDKSVCLHHLPVPLPLSPFAGDFRVFPVSCYQVHGSGATDLVACPRHGIADFWIS